jgi:hypothetical protein
MARNVTRGWTQIRAGPRRALLDDAGAGKARISGSVSILAAAANRIRTDVTFSHSGRDIAQARCLRGFVLLAGRLQTQWIFQR